MDGAENETSEWPCSVHLSRSANAQTAGLFWDHTVLREREASAKQILDEQFEPQRFFAQLARNLREHTRTREACEKLAQARGVPFNLSANSNENSGGR